MPVSEPADSASQGERRAGEERQMSSSGSILVVLVVVLLAVCSVAAAAETGAPVAPAAPAAAFRDDPAAHALWDRMLQAMREAQTLQWESQHRWFGEGGKEISHCTYRIWMKKPNYARMEVVGEKEPPGVLVLDGTYRWIYWPGAEGKPRYGFEKDDAAYERIAHTSYMKEQAPQGRYSLWHQTNFLGGGMGMPVIQPSYFHGGTSSLDDYLDGVGSTGTEQVGGELCDVIEVSVMKHQRSRYLWLSRRDHLPRKLREVTRVEYDIVTDETWSNVKVNEPLDDAMFQWTPPEGWQEWRLPELEDGLLKPGTPAPDFDMARLGGGRVKLSDLRGKVVWLVVWRVGCPPCRDEAPALEKLHQQYAAKGLALIGVDVSDEPGIAEQFVRETGATFPNAVDNSEAAQKVVFGQYQTLEGTSAVPMHYIIDREGRVVDAWYGEDMARGEAALQKLGIGEARK